MRNKIKIGFVDFWPNFNPKDDYIFGKNFDKKFNVDYTNINPDYLFFSAFGQNNKTYNCKKIFFSPENFFVHKYPSIDYILGDEGIWKNANYSITSFDLNDNRNFRMLCYVRKYGFGIKNQIYDRSYKKKNNKFLYLQNNCQDFRDNFVKKLQKYVQVDCFGKCLNNKNFHVEDKIKFMSDYKFVISFENSSYPGYHTEKLIDNFIAKSYPIYWGDSNIKSDYDHESYLYYDDFKSDDEFIEKIISLDVNVNEYYDRLNVQPLINENIFNEELFYKFIEKILYD